MSDEETVEAPSSNLVLMPSAPVRAEPPENIEELKLKWEIEEKDLRQRVATIIEWDKLAMEKKATCTEAQFSFICRWFAANPEHRQPLTIGELAVKTGFNVLNLHIRRNQWAEQIKNIQMQNFEMATEHGRHEIIEIYKGLVGAAKGGDVKAFQEVARHSFGIQPKPEGAASATVNVNFNEALKATEDSIVVPSGHTLDMERE